MLIEISWLITWLIIKKWANWRFAIGIEKITVSKINLVGPRAEIAGLASKIAFEPLILPVSLLAKP